MKEVLHYTFSKKAAAIQKMQLLLNHREDSLTLSVEGNSTLLSALDLFVKDENSNILFHRQLGTGENVITITNNVKKASIGSIPCNFEKGIYTIELALWNEAKKYIQNAMQVNIICETEFKNVKETCGDIVWMEKKGNLSGYEPGLKRRNHAGWYAGDFHCHTILSDGHEYLSNQMVKSELMGLDFYSATEHNLVPSTWVNTDLLVLCGIEITTVYGHANIFGFRKRPDNLDLICSEDNKILFEETLDQLSSEGCVISINHPFLHPWEWLYPECLLKDIQCIEIINDPTYPDNHEANRKAIAFIDALWNDGWKICGIGGSDTHALLQEWYTPESGPSIVGDPTTHVFCDGLSQNSVLDGVRKCHAYITRWIKINFDMRLNDKCILPGDEITEEGNLYVTFHLENVREKITFFVVKDGVKEDIDYDVDLDHRNASITYQTNWKRDTYHWLRFGAENQNGECVLYTNPVYSGEKEHQLHTFGDAANEIQ